MEKLDPQIDGASPNIVEKNIQELKKFFPEIVTEGNVDFEVLREVLGDYVDDRPERYSFNWNGKSRARRIAQTPSTGTLRPCPDESVNWETSENLFIEGDNLEVLKLLQKSYHKRVKLIYIDPPYNTGSEFIYPDKFQDNLDTYLKYSGQVDNQGFKFSANSETSGRYHTNWLNMMYPRLKLARNLLSDDGVIIISIDDHEVPNLRRMADEVFGEENFVAQLVWAGGRKNDSKLVSVSHEYMLVYVRDREHLKSEGIKWRVRKKGLDGIYKAFAKIKRQNGSDYSVMTKKLKEWFKSLPDGDPAKRQKHYSHVDERGIYFPDNISWPGGGGPKYEVLHPLTGEPVSVPSRGWMFSDPNKMQRIIEENRVHFGVDETAVPCIKSYLEDREEEVIYSVFYQDGRAATKRLRRLMGDDVFDHPKDEFVLAELIEACTSDGDLILDFFAGSCTTVHSCLIADQREECSRRFVMVQLPEPCDPKDKTGKKALKAGYKTIADIGRDRIRKAAADVATNADFGFRFFKLDSTNILPWDVTADSLEDALLNATHSLKHHRSELDVLFELLLKYGLDLAVSIEERNHGDATIYIIGAGALIVCLNESISLDTVEVIAAMKAELNPETSRVVFRDSGFDNDIVKTNAIQTLNRALFEEIKSI